MCVLGFFSVRQEIFEVRSVSVSIHATGYQFVIHVQIHIAEQGMHEIVDGSYSGIGSWIVVDRFDHFHFQVQVIAIQIDVILKAVL